MNRAAVDLNTTTRAGRSRWKTPYHGPRARHDSNHRLSHRTPAHRHAGAADHAADRRRRLGGDLYRQQDRRRGGGAPGRLRFLVDPGGRPGDGGAVADFRGTAQTRTPLSAVLFRLGSHQFRAGDHPVRLRRAETACRCHHPGDDDDANHDLPVCLRDAHRPLPCRQLRRIAVRHRRGAGDRATGFQLALARDGRMVPAGLAGGRPRSRSATSMSRCRDRRKCLG